MTNQAGRPTWVSLALEMTWCAMLATCLLACDKEHWHVGRNVRARDADVAAPLGDTSQQNSRIAPYAREGSTTSAAADLVKVNRAVRAANILPAKFHDLLDGYPQNLPPDFAENLYWAQFRAHGEDTVALVHVFQATFDGTVVIVQRHYYVSTGYNAEQAIVGFLPVAEGTLVIYTNHTSTDQVAGFGGSAKRAIGRKFMAGELEKLFEKTRGGFGR
jgi:hypothetical protein